ncbi:thromboxane-A synthase [Raphidocelis subcapitata]|uniref:Thromboxane-A synthase n=1 Tax=Raphidocelis subcapitata TaxID=307507 RepID=A0A2V0P432_9CHLO|nr:thromboxane-A synthase [Raphidocelis subcapitata]|eukprot:GBF94618.1 thromboxane-A synthase [Raphidocelis subcapitata]
MQPLALGLAELLPTLLPTLQHVVAAVLAVAVLAIVVDGFAIPQRIALRHIPGTPPRWLLGHMLRVKRRHRLFLYEMWEEMGSEHGKIFKWFWGTQPVITIRDAELARLVCVKHFKAFPHRSMFYPPQPLVYSQVLGSGLTFAQGPYWSSTRAALQPLFHSSGLASYHRITSEAVGELEGDLAAAAAEGAPVDVAAAMCNLALKVVGEAAFGVKFDVLEKDAAGRIKENPLVSATKYVLENTAAALTFMITPRLLKPLVWAAVRTCPTRTIAGLNLARSQIYTAAIALIKNAMGRMGAQWVDDLGMEKAFANPESAKIAAKYAGCVPAEGSVVDHLVAARNKATGAALRAHQIVGQANSVVVAGHDTTSFMMASAIYYLATNGAARARLVAEVDAFGGAAPGHGDLERFPYVEAALHEALRLNPPGWMTSRECVADVDLDGWRVPAGSVVYVDIRAIQRDPEHWGPDPLAYRPERFLKDGEEAKARHPLAHMPFGAGPRLCIGYKLAMQEAITTVVRLFQRFEFEFDGSMHAGGAPTLRPGITLGFRDGMWCRVRERPRAPCC